MYPRRITPAVIATTLFFSGLNIRTQLKMKSAIKYLITLFIIFTALAARASAADLSLGVQGEANALPWRNYKTTWSALPYVGYDNAHWYVDGLDAGVYAVNDGVNQLKARLFYLDMEFDPKRSHASRMRELDNRHATMMGGVSYQRITPVGAFRAELSTDTLGESNGLLGTLAWAGQVSLTGVDIYPEAGVDWLNAQQARYYYGISREEASRSGMSAYSPGQAFSPWLAVAADWHVTSHLHFYLQPRITFLPAPLRHSPMVSQSHFWTLNSGLVWTF